MSIKTVVLFGQTGASKSSVVNLMAGEERAVTSPGTYRCTVEWQEYPIAFDGDNYKVFDTVGLQDPQLRMQEYLDAIVNAHNLIMKLKKENGIDLLLFCVRAGRFTSTIRNNYRLFYEWLCEKKFPIVLVITGLEREKNMEDWWTRYRGTFDKYKIVVDGHACITAASHLDGRHQELYQLSRQLVRNLVREHTRDKPSGESKGNDGYNRGDGYTGSDIGGDGWLRKLMRKLFLGGHILSKKEIVTILTDTYAMPLDAALQLASQIRQDLVSRKSSI